MRWYCVFVLVWVPDEDGVWGRWYSVLIACVIIVVVLVAIVLALLVVRIIVRCEFVNELWLVYFVFGL